MAEAGDERRESADLFVECYVKERDPEEVDDALSDLEADVTAAVLADQTLSGTVFTCVRSAVKTDMQEFAQIGVGWRPIRFTVEYQWTAAAP